MNLIAVILIIFSTILLNLTSDSQCNSQEERGLSTSIAGLEQLVEVEQMHIELLETYAERLEQKLHIVQSGVQLMRLETEKLLKQPEAYLSNPLNTFSFIRRLHADWINWELYMTKSVGEAEVDIIRDFRAQMPIENDIRDAAAAIYRLQTTYDLKPADIATGLLNGKQYDVKLKSIDSYAIGNELFKQEQYYQAGVWLYTALQMYEDSAINVVFHFSRLNIIEMYSETLVKQDRPQDALILIEMAFKEDPHSAKYLQRKVQIENMIKIEQLEPKQHSTPSPEPYELGCRGKFNVQQLAKLYCRYNSTTSAFLKLAPLKMEEIYMEPYMVLYHDVLSDAEISELKEIARPRLTRATLYKNASNSRAILNVRTSKVAWLSDNLNELTMRLNQRITDMTGFNLQGSEMLQVMNYGLGGHHEEHFDFFNVSQTADVVRMNGDRLSTVLFYLSDVEQGGATVFPNIKVSVFPRKGTAIMWYNLNNRGEADWKTLHAACPVIVGSKWVSTKWIRERNQIFVRPSYKE